MLLNHPLIHALSAPSIEGNSDEITAFGYRLSYVRVIPFWGTTIPPPLERQIGILKRVLESFTPPLQGEAVQGYAVPPRTRCFGFSEGLNQVFSVMVLHEPLILKGHMNADGSREGRPSIGKFRFGSKRCSA